MRSLFVVLIILALSLQSAFSFEYFKPGYGLVTEYDPTTENCNLFYAQNLTLKKELTEEDRKFFESNMDLKRINLGLFNRRGGVEDTRSTSHDEITGFMVASHLLKTDHAKEIWEYLVDHYGIYNNNKKVFLPYNPGNFYAWGAYAGSSLRWIFAPVYLVNLTISLNKPANQTSGKIIYWLEIFTMPEDWFVNKLKKYYVYEMRKQYGDKWLRAMYEIYFAPESREHFPLWRELDGYENRKSEWFGSN